MVIDIDEANSVGSFKRSIATAIDVFLVLFLRIFAMQILGVVWLNRQLQRLSDDFEAYFGTNEITDPGQLVFIYNHDVFAQIVTFLILIFLVGALYHAYLNSSNWCATVGKRVLGFVVVDKKGQKVGFLAALLHYFLSLVPMVIIFYLVMFQLRLNLGFIEAITANFVNIILIFIAVSWVNIHIFTSRKVTFYDLLCGFVLVEAKTGHKFPWSK